MLTAIACASTGKRNLRGIDHRRRLLSSRGDAGLEEDVCNDGVLIESSAASSFRAVDAPLFKFFLEIRDFIMPSDCKHDIVDWSSPRLPESSPHFDASAEWWSVFLFTIHAYETRRLTVIAGSTTD